KEVNDDSVVLTIRIKTRTKDIEIERKQIANARLAIQF
ncbi:MAG: ribosome maturation factor RimP, partial [Trichococcus flocculiformis]